MAGVLTVTGTVEVSQFWPSGESDADTVHLTLTNPQTAFQFRASPGHSSKVTHAFDGAGMFETVQGKKKFKPLIRNGQITLRLQGIDAPELHYLPRVKGALNFREFFGETCTVALGDRTKHGGATSLQCQFVTAIDHPQEAVDKFGRFVGDILVDPGTSKEWNVNDWLAAQGWAFPAFYNSMSVAEVNRILAAANAAEKAKLGIWKYYSKKIGPLDWTMVFRNKSAPDPNKDRGPVIFPKMFRRLSDYSAKVKNGSFKGTFLSFMTSHKPPDVFYRTKDFLANKGQPPKKLRVKLASQITATGQFTARPADLVFEEANAVIVDSNNKPIPAGW